MDTSEKAQKELEEIERQAAQMQSASGQTDETRRQLGLLQQRIETLRKQLVRTNAMEKTELARHMQRPHTLDYIERIFTDWSEIHGDRRFGDDPAMVCGMARFHGDEVVVVGTEKGRDTKARMFRNFGLPNPEGYRKALRVMQIAEKYSRPIFSLVDVTGANPGVGAEERGQAEAIAHNLREMARLEVPIIAAITRRWRPRPRHTSPQGEALKILRTSSAQWRGGIKDGIGASSPRRPCGSPPKIWSIWDASTPLCPNPRAGLIKTMKRRRISWMLASNSTMPSSRTSPLRN
jgi:hypothetical protein